MGLSVWTVSGLLMLGGLAVAPVSRAGNIYLHMLSSGTPAASRALGERLGGSGDWYLQMELGQTSWFASEMGVGTNNLADDASWSWYAANWYQDGEGSNKRVQTNLGPVVQFTSVGNWYFNGRAKGDSGNPWHYANTTTWGNSSNFSPSYYFTVTNLPWSLDCTVTNNLGPESMAVSWDNPGSYHVLVVRRLGDWPDAPTQGTAYSAGNTYGTDNRNVVVYKGVAASATDYGLLAGSNYYYSFFTENFSYYSISNGVVLSGGAKNAVTPLFSNTALQDSFTYGVGDSAVGKNGGRGWTNAWNNGGGSPTISSGSLSVPVNYPTAYGNQVKFDPGSSVAGLHRHFGAFTTGTIYAAYALHVSGALGGEQWAGLSLFNGETELCYVGAPGSSSLMSIEQYEGSRSNSAYNISAGGANHHLIVFRYNFATRLMQAKAYFSTSSTMPLAEPTEWDVAFTFAEGAIPSVNNIKLNCGGWGSGDPGDVFYDEVRVATGWAELMGAKTLYVDASKADDSGDGLSWASAKKTIQAAVNLTRDNDTVLVTNGVYDAGSRVTPNYALTNRVCITNNIVLQSVNGPDVTFIKGAAGSNGSNDVDSIRCVFMSQGTLSGFTLTNGYTMATGIASDFYEESGGGLWMTNNCLASNCVMSGNAAAYYGGGAFFYQGGLLTHCTLSGNAATDGGGARLYQGGTLNQCVISNNTASSRGGGVQIYSTGTANGCLIIDNTADMDGGGVRMYDGGTLNNSLVFGNEAVSRGGGVSFGGSTSGTMSNTTVSGNLADYGGGVHFDGVGIMNNSISWSNTASIADNDIRVSSGGAVRYSCASQGVTNGVNGCTTNNPLFVDAVNSNYHLSANSPCINSGDNTYAPGSYDLDGNARIQMTTVDMGAYEEGFYISAISGPYYGGGTLTISTNGTFGTITNVTVGGMVASIQLSDSGSVQFIVPSFSTIGAKDIVIQTSDHGDYSWTGLYTSLPNDPILPVYYAVGQNTNDHMTGTPTLTIAGGTGTFSVAQTAVNMGVGDCVTYNGSSRAFISGKVSTAKWKLITAQGETPDNVTDATVNSIRHPFASLSAAESGASGAAYLNTTNLAYGYVLNFPCYYDSGSESSETVVDGWNTGSNTYIKIYTPTDATLECNRSQRHAGVWDDSAFNMCISNNYPTPIEIRDEYVAIEGLQIYLYCTMHYGSRPSINVSLDKLGVISVSHCIIRGDDPYENRLYGILFANSSHEVTLHAFNNDICQGIMTDTNSSNGFDLLYAGKAYVYNNTVYRKAIGICENGVAVYAKNNICISNVVDYQINLRDGTTNNISSDATSPNAECRNKSVVFISETAGSEDFRLHYSDTNALDQGLDLSADPYLPFTDDISGQTRPIGAAWDIGADERDAAYVDASRPDDSGDGRSWATAKKTIQAGVDMVGIGGFVLVTNGVYDAGSRVTPGYDLTNRVCITNNIVVQSVNGPDVTFIVGAPGSNGSNDVDSIRCVFMSRGALFGFTLTNGFTMATGFPSDIYEESGGGLWMTANCTASNCVMTGNGAGYFGAGVFQNDGGTLEQCVLKGNVSVSSGGGFAIFTNGLVKGCTVSNNAALNNGGGAYVLNGGLVTNSTLYGNLGGQNGGGIYIVITGTVTHCTLEANLAQTYHGGGAYCASGGTLTACTILTNIATSGGGGVYMTKGGTLNQCVISNNVANNHGGGVYLNYGGILSNCTLSGNSAVYDGGGARFQGTGGLLVGCTLSGNKATDGGGARLYLGGTLNQCVISNNTASVNGGGVQIQTNGTVNQCTIISNTAAQNGGGVRMTSGGTLNNSLIIRNRATTTGGGGVSFGGTGSGTMSNCTVAGNTAPQGGGVYLLSASVMNNSISWSNTATTSGNDIILSGGGTIRYSCASQGVTNGVNGCTTNHPLFIDVMNTNFHLRSQSPCINSGNNTYASGSYDLDGNARIRMTTVDMGAYEAAYAMTMDNGPYVGGNTVTITKDSALGNGSDITNVLVGGVSATIDGQGATWVRIIMPAAESTGSKDVVVQSTSLGETTFEDAYTYNPAGEIFSPVAPASGSWTGGYSVVISGTNLCDGMDVTNVTLCGVSVSGITSQSKTQVVVTAGTASSLGIGDVVVYSRSYGVTTRDDAFEYTGSVMHFLGTNGAETASGAAASTAVGTDYGMIEAGETISRQFSITNNGTAPLLISGWSTNGAGAGAYRISNIVSQISVGGVSNFYVTFTPSVGGSYAASVRITNNAMVNPYIINLMGYAYGVSTNNGPYIGGNEITIVYEGLGNGSDITNVLVGGVSATITGQDTGWVTIQVPACEYAGTKDIVVQSTSAGATTFTGVYTYNKAGYIPSSSVALPRWLDLTNSWVTTTNGVTFEGDVAGRKIGFYSVSGAGDVNGDGFQDYMMNSSSNQVYLIYGRSQDYPSTVTLTNSLADGSHVVMITNQTGKLRMAAAGDVNDDGCDDFLVGDEEGRRAYLIYGRVSAMPSSIHLTNTWFDGTNGIVMASSVMYFGLSVNGAGDVNGDGCDDLVLGNYRGANLCGETYLVYGRRDYALPAEITMTDTWLDGTNGMTFTGMMTNDHAGYCVSRAGDVNGDGLSDMLIGAERANPLDPTNSVFAPGAAYLVCGRTNGFSAQVTLSTNWFDGTNGAIFIGKSGPTWAGDAVSTAGDVNGDHLDDIIVSDHWNREHYVVYGRTNSFPATSVLSTNWLNGTNGMIIRPDSSQICGPISSAGDVNGDGYSDVLFSTPGVNPTNRPYGTGAAYLLYGTSTGFPKLVTATNVSWFNGVNGVLLAGTTPTGNCGTAISGVGDVNGDGLSDMLISAPLADTFRGLDAGEVYLVYGGSKQGYQYVNPSSGSWTGNYSVTISGHYLGNGSDITNVVLCGTNVSAILSQNATQVVVSASAMTNLLVGNVEVYSTSFGVTVRTNGFEYTGSIIKFVGTNKVSVTSGVAAAVSLGSDFQYRQPGTTGFRIFSITNNGTAPMTISGIYTNGAGASAFIIENMPATIGIGAVSNFYVSFAPSSEGSYSASLVISNNSMLPGFVVNFTGVGIALETNDGPFAGGNVLTVSNATAIGNGSDITNVLVGGIAATIQAQGDNWVRIILPAALVPGMKDIIVQSTSHGSTAFCDTYQYNPPGFIPMARTANPMPAYVIVTNTWLDGTNGITLAGAKSSDESGSSVSSIGDVNGDGLADMLVGAHLADPDGKSYAGEAYLIYGQPGVALPSTIVLTNAWLDGTNGTVFYGMYYSGARYFGSSVSGAGDVNGDGLADFLISATWGATNSSRWRTGLTYLLFGTTNKYPSTVCLTNTWLDGTNGVLLEGAYDYQYSGYSVSGAGDVNGDGYADILVSAPDPLFGSECGEVSLIFGRGDAFPPSIRLTNTWFNGTNGVLFSGATTNSRIGSSVRGAGDVNGDGYDDFLIGATNASPSGKTQAGETYLIFGHATPFQAQVVLTTTWLDGSNGYLFEGAVGAGSCGSSVGLMGDVNLDGYNDFMIGAERASYSGLNGAGESYLVYGDFASRTRSSAIILTNTWLDGTNGVLLRGRDAAYYAGHSISTAGDVNGDGADDFIIGAYNATVSNMYGAAGESYLVYGCNTGLPKVITLQSSWLNGTNGVLIAGKKWNERCGWSVSGGGDVNGDGYADLLVGAVYGDSAAGGDAGETYLIYGRANSSFTPVSPSSGSFTGGYPVVINGYNLGNGTDITNVTLCGVTVSGITGQSKTQVVVTAASTVDLGVGDVVVYSTSYGMTVKSNAFTYVAPNMHVLGTNGVEMADNAAASSDSGTAFGSYLTDSLIQHTFAITNNGTEVLHIHSWVTNGTGASAYYVSNMPSDVAIGTISNFDISFSVESIGSYSASVVLNNNSMTPAFTINLTGMGFGLSTNIGPYGGGNSVTISAGTLGNGSDITNVLVGGVAATITGQSGSTVTITMPPATTNGLVSIVVQSTSAGSTTFPNVYTYNLPGEIHGRFYLTNKWTDVAGLPEARQEVGAEVLNGKLYVVDGFYSDGGYTPVQITTTNVYQYDGEQWSTLSNAPFSGYAFDTATLSNEMYAMGIALFVNPNTTFYTNVYSFNGTDWTSRPGLPMKLSDAGADTLNGMIYCVGGCTNAGTYGSDKYYITNVFRYNGTGWASVDGLPTARGSMGVVTWNDKLYAIGGYSTNGYYTNVYVFDGSVWTETKGLPKALSGPGAAVFEGQLYVAGGQNAGGAVTNVYRFDGTNWSDFYPLPQARRLLTVREYNDGLYAIGGSKKATSYPFSYYSITNVYRYPGLSNALPVQPSFGSWTGGYSVIIRGTNLGNGVDITNVTLCGVSVSGITSQSATQLTVTAATSSTFGLGDVIVYSVSFGATIKSNAFTYLPDAPTNCYVLPDGPESIKCYWSPRENAGHVSMIVRRLGAVPTGPVNGVNYTNLQEYGTDTKVIYKGTNATAGDMELFAHTSSNYYYSFFTCHDASDTYSLTGAVRSGGYTLNTNTPAFHEAGPVDSFSYWPADITSQNGGTNWAGAWSWNNGIIQMAAGSLSAMRNYPGVHGNMLWMNPDVTNSSRIFRAMPEVNSGVLYLSYVGRYTVDPSGYTRYISLSLYQNDDEKLSFGIPGAVTNVSVQKYTGYVTSQGTHGVKAGDTFTVLAKIDLDNHVAYVSGFGTNDVLTPSEPAWQASLDYSGGYMSAVTKIALVAGAYDGTSDIGEAYFDEVHMATNWQGLIQSTNILVWVGLGTGGVNERAFNTKANWSPNALPYEGQSLMFSALEGESGRFATNNYTEFTAWRQITFTENNYSMALHGNALKIMDKVENVSTNSHSIHAYLSFDGEVSGYAYVEPVYGNLTVNGTVYIDSNKELRVTSSNGKKLTFGSVIADGTGGTSARFALLGNTEVEMQGANTYGGGTVVSNGMLTIHAETGLGATPATFQAEHLTIGNWAILNADMEGYYRTMNANRGIRLNGGGGKIRVETGTLHCNGAVSGTGALAKDGAGCLTLAGQNTFTNELYIDEGALKLTDTTDPLNSWWVNIGLESGTTSPEAGLLLGNGVTLDNDIHIRTNAAVSSSKRWIGMVDSGTAHVEGGIRMTDGLSLTNTSGSVLIMDGLIYEDDNMDLIVNVEGSGITAFNHEGMAFKYLHVMETAELRCDLDNTLKNWVEASLFGSGRLHVNGTDQAVQSIYGDGELYFSGGGSLSVYMGYFTPFDGTITGSGDFVKTGTGSNSADSVFYLRGESYWTGNTIINDGTLVIGSETNLGRSSIVISSNATLMITNNAAFDSARTVTLAGAGQFSVPTGTVAQFYGTVGGVGTMSLNNGGELRLSGANTFTNIFFVNNGIVSVTAADPFDCTRIVLGPDTAAWNATLDVGAGSTVDVAITVNASTLSNTKTIRNTSTGAAAVTGELQVEGNVQLNLENTESGTLTIQDVDNDGNKSYYYVGANSATIAGDIHNDGGTGIDKRGAGTLVLSGSSTFNGGLYIVDGQVTLANANTLAACPAVYVGDLSGDNPGRVAVAAGVTVTNRIESRARSSGAGTNCVMKVGNGNGTISGGLDMFYAATINNSFQVLESGTGELIFTGGWNLGGTQRVAFVEGDVRVAGGGITNGTPASGYNGLVKRGAGTLEIDSVLSVNIYHDQGNVVIGTNCTFSGVDTYYFGTRDNPDHTTNNTYLTFRHAQSFTNGIVVGTLGLETGIRQINFENDDGTVRVAGSVVLGTNANRYLILSNGTANAELAGNVSGSGGLIKQGAGTVLFTANATYTGLTRVEEGTLALSNINNTAVMVVSNGGTLIGRGTVGAITSYGAIGPAMNGEVGTLNCSALTMENGSQYNFGISENGDDLINVDGTVSFQNGDVVTINITNLGGGSLFRKIKLIGYDSSSGYPSWHITGDVPAGMASLLTVTNEAGGWYLSGGEKVECGITNAIHGTTDMLVKINTKTVSSVDYDLIYMDAPTYADSLSNSWKFAARMTANSESTIFTNNLGTLNTNNLRFYRISPMAAWSNKSGRLASKEIYVAKRVQLHSGRNWVALPCIPLNPSYSNVFGYNLPGHALKANATYVDLYGVSGLSLTVTSSVYFTGSHWYSPALTQSVDNIKLPLEQGFMVNVPDGLNCEFAVVGELRTNTQAIAIAGSNQLSFISVLLPGNMHPSNLNLTASGFVGGTRLMKSDELYVWDRMNQRLKTYSGGSVPLWMWYKTTDSNWYWSNGSRVTGTPIGQDDALIIYRRSGGPWTWINNIHYTVPTKEMTP